MVEAVDTFLTETVQHDVDLGICRFILCDKLSNDARIYNNSAS
jgi:hypothetical protein